MMYNGIYKIKYSFWGDKMKLNKKILGISLGIFILGGAIFLGVPILNGALKCDHTEESHSKYGAKDLGFMIMDDKGVKLSLEEINVLDNTSTTLVFECIAENPSEVTLSELGINGMEFGSKSNSEYFVATSETISISLGTQICELEKIQGTFVVKNHETGTTTQDFDIDVD